MLKRALLLLIASSLPLAAFARTTDRQQPADISAGHATVSDGARVLSEGVTIVQGTLKIDADRAELESDASGNLTRVILTGTPVTWTEILDTGVRLDARAERIDYRMAAQKVTLIEDVLITRGPDEISGDHIEYDLATSALDAGGENKGRVVLRITPQAANNSDGDQ